MTVDGPAVGRDGHEEVVSRALDVHVDTLRRLTSKCPRGYHPAMEKTAEELTIALDVMTQKNAALLANNKVLVARVLHLQGDLEAMLKKTEELREKFHAEVERETAEVRARAEERIEAANKARKRAKDMHRRAQRAESLITKMAALADEIGRDA